MVSAGMKVRRDEAGNVVGRYGASANDDRPPFLLGSHVDTVPDAGRLDGALGVLAAIAAVESLAARGERRPFSPDVAAFAHEEGTRFGVAYLGFAAYAGLFERGWLDLVDESGTTAGDAPRAIGHDPPALLRVARPPLAG
jgi:allantoate deiminase